MRRLLLIGWVVTLLACAPAGQDTTMAVNVSTLTGGCGQTLDPVSTVERLRVTVTGPDQDTGLTTTLLESDHKLSTGSNELRVKGIPSGSGSTLTLQGFATGEITPSWFGRHRNLSIVQDEVNKVEMVMTRLGQTACMTPPTSFTHRAFPAAVTLSDGRVLISGGFTRATTDTQNQVVLNEASDVALLYDPTTGILSQTSGTMTRGRAGHTMVAVSLSAGEKVLVFGGTTEMVMKPNNGFPFGLDTAKSLDSFEVFDVATQTFTGQDATGTPNQMFSKRAFPLTQRLFDNSILVAGGGTWASTDTTYTYADLWTPSANDGQGGMFAFTTNRPFMNAVHNGGVMVKLEDTSEGLTRILVIGGTTDQNNVVELFTQSSNQAGGASGAFKSFPFPGLPSLFFPSVTPLQSRQLLVVGGVAYANTGFQAPTQQAFLLKVEAGDGVTVEAIDTSDTGCSGRFFHGAVPSFDGSQAILTGGFSDFSGIASAEPCTFDLSATPRFTKLSAFQARAGHAVVRLLDDTLLLVGGMEDRTTLDGTSLGLIEVFTPSTIPLTLATP